MSNQRATEYFAHLISNVSHANGVFRITFAQQEAENTVQDAVRLLIPTNQLQSVMQGIANAANEIRDKMQQAQATTGDANPAAVTPAVEGD